MKKNKYSNPKRETKSVVVSVRVTEKQRKFMKDNDINASHLFGWSLKQAGYK